MKKILEERPWGNFVRYTHNEQTTVKVITVNPGEELSLQTHEKRREFWRILKGRPHVTIGEVTVEAVPGDEFEIPERTLHQISSSTEEVQFLEIAFGEFDENDIVRIKDRYGRIS